MGKYASKVIKIAKAEKGYLEKSAVAYKKNPKVLDKKTDGAGKDNYTKYGRDMHKIYPAVMDFPAYWCDAFVDWCFYRAYGVTTAKSLLRGNFDDYTVASASMYEKHGALGTKPKYGSQVFFTRNGKVSGCHHTGLVTKVDSTHFYTMEGNTSGASTVVSNGGGVKAKKYKIADYKGKVIFGYPKYDTEPRTKPQTPTKPQKPRKTTKVESAKSFDKKLAGTYTVTAEVLNIRSGAGKNKTDIGDLKKGTKVACYGYYTTVSGVKWYLVTANGITGYVSSKYLKGGQ
nr:MAG TPA: hypothetical protein [Caudoviricetes sp.]